MSQKRRPFGEIAIELKLIDKKQLQECLGIQERIKKSGQEALLGFPPYIGEILVSRNYIQAEQIKQVLAQQQEENKLEDEKQRETPPAITRTPVGVAPIPEPPVTTTPATAMEAMIPEVTAEELDLAEEPTVKANEPPLSPEKEAEESESAKDKEMVACSHCGTQFNKSLLDTNKRLKCGNCGKHVLGSAEQTQKNVKKFAPKITFSLPQFVRSRLKKIAIPGYQIFDLLGEDTTGSTYQACRVSDAANPVVIKIFNEETRLDEKFITQVGEMVRRASTLHLHHVRKIHEIGRCPVPGSGDLVYVVSEYVEGKSLRQVLAQGTIISIEKAITIGTRLAKILLHAYEVGLTHGDIAPHNILISQEGKVVLANLGIPNKVAQNLFYFAEMDGSTALYVAPEVVSATQTCDYRSDIYSLGALLYQLLAKRPAFEGKSPFETLNRLTADVALPPIQLYNPQVSPEIFKILEKMMEPDPEKRYQKYSELIAHLQDPQKIHNVETSFPVPLVPTEESKRREEEESLKPLSGKALHSSSQMSWGKIIFAGVLILVVGWWILGSMSRAKEIAQAKKEYEDLQKEFRKHKENVEKLQELEQSFQEYKRRYRNVNFSKGENFRDYADSYLKKLDDARKNVISQQIYSVMRKADQYAQKFYFCAALEMIERIPKNIREIRNDEINKKYAAILKDARGCAETAIKIFLQAQKDKNYNKALEALEKCTTNFPKEAKSLGDLGQDLDNLGKKLEEAKKEAVAYQLYVTEEKQKKSQKIFLSAMEQINGAQQRYDYKEFLKTLQPFFQEKDLLPDVREKLEKYKYQGEQLKFAKETLLRYVKRIKNTPVYYKYRSYPLESISDREFMLRGKKTIPWPEFPKHQLHMLLDMLIPYINPQESIAFGVWCISHKNYMLAHKLLKNVSDSEQTKIAMQILETSMGEETNELVSSLQLAERSGDWEKAIGYALALKSDYLLPGLSSNASEAVSLDRFFLRAFQQFCGRGNKAYQFFDCQEPQEQLVNVFSQARTKFENGLLWCGSGKGLFSSDKRIRGVCGLCRFSKDSERLEVGLGNFLFKIEGSGKVYYHIYGQESKFQASEIGSLGNKWCLWGLYSADNQMHWHCNGKTLYTFQQSESSSPDKVSFQTTTTKEGGIWLDDLYFNLQR